MSKLAFYGACAAAAVIGSTVGYYGGKALVARLPDTFVFCGIRGERRVK